MGEERTIHFILAKRRRSDPSKHVQHLKKTSFLALTCLSRRYFYNKRRYDGRKMTEMYYNNSLYSRMKHHAKMSDDVLGIWTEFAKTARLQGYKAVRVVNMV